jgi:hypothetical protein
MGQPNTQSTPEEEPRGLECPRCACRHLRVLYTRQRAGRIVRVRECRHCKRRVITYESISAWRIPGGDDRTHRERGLASVFDWPDAQV